MFLEMESMCSGTLIEQFMYRVFQKSVLQPSSKGAAQYFEVSSIQKLPQKRSHQAHLSNSHKKIFILGMFKFYNKIYVNICLKYFQVICISIILNVNNDPLF